MIGLVLVTHGQLAAEFARRAADFDKDRLLPALSMRVAARQGIEPARLFVRGAAVNQTYFHAGSASGREGNLSLFGAQVSVGLNY